MVIFYISSVNLSNFRVYDIGYRAFLKKGICRPEVKRRGRESNLTSSGSIGCLMSRVPYFGNAMGVVPVLDQVKKSWCRTTFRERDIFSQFLFILFF